ncbi:uncharacterized protein [Littorina saxatilis]|uniref:Uncharacterized protein n=1 Tax=Littorina saxatilis TaxID=31220 RepID=A0AAN9AUM3_9CAEN
MAHRGHTCSQDICIRCGRVCPFHGRDVCLACAPSSQCLPWWLDQSRQQDEDDANNGQDPAPDNPHDACLGQWLYLRQSRRHLDDNNAEASFIQHGIPCTPLRAHHLSNAGFILAVDRKTLCCKHCGVRAPVSSLMRTPEENAFEDAVIQHILRNPLCQHAQGLLPIRRDINQAY